MYRLIEQRPDQHETPAEVGGRTYPVPSIVEDDDGLRLLLTRNLWVPIDLWTWASASGAVALVNVERMLYVLASDFAEHHTQNRMRGLVLAENHWHSYRAGMTYLEMAGVQHTDPGEADAEPIELIRFTDKDYAIGEVITWNEPVDGLEGGRERRGKILSVEDGALLVRPTDGLGLVEEDLKDLGEFVHLHTHSEYSPLDGVTGLDDMMKIIAEDGQRAIAITDHGNCAAHPALQLAADGAGIQPIFGMEANFVDVRTVKGAEVRGAYQHLVLWAMDNVGLRNLWAMSTEGYTEEAFYARPRIDWDTLERHAEGVMVSTACERGPVVRPYLEGNEELALANLGRLQQIFGDRLYVELHTNGRAETHKANEWLVKIAEERNLPMVTVVDSHYGRKCDQHTHRVWLSVQTDSDVADDNGLFGGGHDYHLMTAREVREALNYLPADVVAEAMRNTVRVARRCTAKIEPKTHQPTFSKATDEWPDPVAHDVDRLWSMITDRWDERIPTNRDQSPYLARVEREMTLLVKKNFCGYYLMEAEMVNWAKDQGILVGPGRGSGGGSLVAFIIRITEIDPVEHELLFERFMTEGRESPPDFDVDFPSSKKGDLFDHVAERWGVDNVAIVGTHLRLKSKGILNDISRALKSSLPEDYYVDFRKCSEIIAEAEASTAGLGLSWEDLWVQEGDRLDPYREKYPEVFRYADELHGKLKTYGKHPAGVVISTEGSIVDSLPLRKGADDGPMVCQFDMTALERLGYIKFDLLNLRTLDTLQMCVDLIKETTGEWVDPYGWKHDEQYADPQIFDEISAGWTLGVFQIETQSGTRLTRRFQPRTVAELADVITLVRPGPMRSGLTETYFRRRNGEEEVHVPDPRLKPVLVKTNGCMLYQEDIMKTCMVLADYDSNEADAVRKILGKKKVDQTAAAGSQFETRAVENGTDPMVAHLLWEQMAEFAKYSFNRAHAFAYAILGMWTAWFKFHYPVQFLCAALSTVKEERIAEFVEEARRMGYRIQPPDINESKEGFTASAMSVRYGLLSIKGVGQAASDAILAGQPYTGWEDFLERKTSKCDSGQVAKLVQIGAFDSLVANRRWLLRILEIDKIAGSDRCQHKTGEPVLITGQLMVGEPPTPETQLLPCAYDWPSEPREPSRQAGRFKKAKALPKKCFRGCRQFTPTAPPTPDEVDPFTDEDIRRIEIDTLGVFLSSTPFDRIPEEDRATCSTAVEVLSAEPGEYIMPGLIRTVRRTKDRHDREMAFVKFATERGELEAVVFSGEFARYHKVLTSGRLVYAVVKKTYRGCNLTLLEDLDASTAKPGEDHQ